MNFQQWWGSVPASVTIGLTIVDFAIRLAALGFVPHNRRPAAALGWLAVIFFIPLIGLALYLLFGNSRLDGRRKRLQRRIAHDTSGTRNQDISAPDADAVPDWVVQAVRMNEHNGAPGPTAGNSAELHPDYAGSLHAMTKVIREAVSFVHCEFYILASDDTTDSLFGALEEAHNRGVRVRVLLDPLGSAGFPGYEAAVGRLEQAGIAWRRMLPVAPPRFHYQRPDLRNHRKILIADNRIGFTGSQNIIDASYNKKSNRRRNLQWRDLMVRLEGPVVPQLNAVFLADWSSEAGTIPNEWQGNTGSAKGRLLCQMLPSGPGLEGEANLRLFNHMLYSARERVTICSPYFVPDESLLMAVTSAAQRGVKVRLLVGATSDHFLTHHAQRSYYAMILAAGVDIHLYPEPFVLHSKFVIVDDRVSVVASSNMDIRSFTLNQEVNLLVIDGGFTGRLNAITDQYLTESHQLEPDTWVQRPLHEKFLDNMCRLTADLQ
ncbi:cardiolipin synthase [Arthrobacter zhaoguopingii]|uniref:cardiolipin synthase n=1 Tax=Arthrobacter zhaoguopingii TaxID=2681491 RepID=UPI0013594DE2|nr:cardiolipin synthase [Arthrobacter zhaoguopingii]